MIIFVLGTTAEVIKLQPVWMLLKEAELDFRIISLGQHTKELEELVSRYGFDHQLICLRSADRENLITALDALKWICKAFFDLTRLIRKYPKNQHSILVQGDTFSTLIGAAVGRLCGNKVVHLEAGLRSANIRSPFPEEVNRRLVSRLANYHLCPTEKESQNLEKLGIEARKIGVTNGNSSMDHLIGKRIPKSGIENYGVITLHRQELLEKTDFFLDTLKTISGAVAEKKVFFVADSRSKILVTKFEISKIHSFTVIDKLQHDQFIKLIGNADWVVTDSGGLQEECAFLGIPTLVHRIATERFDGIGANVVLSEWDLEKITDFLHEYEHLVCKPTEVLDSPSKRVISYLKEWKIL